MATEGATHIADLDITKPDGATEQVDSLDDYHIQIKEVLQRDVNNFAGTALVYGADGSNTNAYAFNSALTITTYTAGIICILDIANANTDAAAATLNIDGISVQAIKNIFGEAVSAGALRVGVNVLVYDGTDFILLVGNASTIVSSGANFETLFSTTLGETTNIPVNATQVIVSFDNLSLDLSGNIHIFLGDASYAYDDAYVYTVHGDGTTAIATDGKVQLANISFLNSVPVHGTIVFTRINGTQKWAVGGNAAGEGVTLWTQTGFIEVTGITSRLKVVSSGIMGFDSGTASVYWL